MSRLNYSLVIWSFLIIVSFHPITIYYRPLSSRLEVREVAGRKIIILNQQEDEDTTVATIIIRASTEHVINDLERAVDDGVNAVRTLCTDPRLLPGAGAVELELSKRLAVYADEVAGLDQYAIRKFAEAFDVVPRTLAENSGCDPTSKMHALHASHVTPNSETMGFDLESLDAKDSVAAGVFDLFATKVSQAGSIR